MKLWIIIDQPQYDYIQKYGYLRSDARKIWPEFKKSYNWLVGEMKNRVGHPPSNIKYPIWAWKQWDGINRKKPDIRSLRHTCGNGTYYRMELDIPEERVLLSNFIDWHYVLSHAYLPFTEQEDDDFNCWFEGSDINYGNWDNYPTNIQNIIEKTWQRIFDFKSIREYSYAGEIKDRDIQATFWVLNKNDIKKIDKFESKETNI